VTQPGRGGASLGMMRCVDRLQPFHQIAMKGMTEANMTAI